MKALSAMKTIKFKLMITCLLISLIPILLIMAYSYNVAFRTVSEKTTESAMMSLRIVAQKIDNEISQLEKQADNINLLLEYQDILDAINFYETDGERWALTQRLDKLLHTFFSPNEAMGAVSISFKKGQDFLYINSESQNQDDFAFLNDKLKPHADKFDVGWNFVSPSEDMPSVIFYRQKTYDTQNKADLHYISSANFILNKQTFTKTFSPGNVGTLGEFYLFDNNHNLVSSSPVNKNSANSITINAEEIVLTKEGTLIDKKNGQNNILVYTTSQKGYTVVQVIPQQNYTGEISQITYIAIVIGIIFTIIIVILTIKVTNFIAKPVQKLNNAMEQFEQGNFSIYVNYDKNNEMGEITNRFNKMVARVKGLVETAIANEKQKKDLEMSALQYQISPHFLCNILASIKSLAFLESADTTAKMLSALSCVLRRTIGNAGLLIPISTELENIRDVLFIQNICHENNITYDITINSKAESCLVPNLILQPIVENAVFHAMDYDTKKVIIKISVEVENDIIILSVRDYGKGIKEENISKLLENKKGSTFNNIGLDNVNQRIKLQFGEQYGLSIHNVSPGIRIDIRIPMLKE